MTLRLHWPDERYVRIYCRDTLDWQTLSWNAQALYVHLCRKATRKGRIDLGRVGRRGLATLVGRPEMSSDLREALAELEADGCVVVDGSALALVDFVEAQEAVSSAKARVRKHREIRQEQDDCNETLPEEEDALLSVTPGYGTAPDRTDGTARPSVRSTEGPAADAAGNGAGSAPSGDALSRAFAADLDAEASRDDRRRARVLNTLGSGWRTVIDTSCDLDRAPSAVEKDLVELKHLGLVERAEQGSPPVTHWRRARGTSATGEGAR